MQFPITMIQKMNCLILITTYLCSATYAKVLIEDSNKGLQDEMSSKISTDQASPTDSTIFWSMESTDVHTDFKDNWSRHKVVYTNMKSLLEDMYGSESQIGKASNKILGTLLSATDTANLIQYAYNRIDVDLKSLLLEKLLAAVDPEVITQTLKGSNSYQFINSNYPLQLDLFLEHFKGNNHKLVNNISDEFIRFMKSIINKGIIQLGKTLSNGIEKEDNDFNFIADIMESSGFKIKEIELIFKLMGLDEPINVHKANEIRNVISLINKTQPNVENHRNPRSGYSSNDGYGYNDGYGIGHYGYSESGGYDHDTGYGHDVGYGSSGSYDGYGYDSGGYDHGGGYDGGYGDIGYSMSSYMKKLDPFMIIAGMAFMSLLCYLAYLAVSKYCGAMTGMMVGGICGRSIGDPYLDLTDTQRLAFDAIDRSQLTYEVQDQESNVLTDEIIDVVNDIWTAYHKGSPSEDEDPLPSSQPGSGIHDGQTCAKATLCSLTAKQTSFYDSLSIQAEAKKLFGSFIALVLGVPSPGELVDQVYSRQVEGEKDPCKHLRQTCSHVYSQ